MKGVQCYGLFGGIALFQLFFNKHASSRSLPDDKVSLNDTKFLIPKCGKCSKQVKEDVKAICCEFCVLW